MNELKGKLAVFEPISVMQMCNLAEATGELELQASDNKASIYFEHGRVTFAGIANRPVRLGEILRQRGIITEEALQSVLGQGPHSKRLGARLLEADLITSDQLREAIEEQIKQVVYEVVRWREGTFAFHDGRKPKSQDILIDIPLTRLMLESLKRMDEERGGA